MFCTGFSQRPVATKPRKAATPMSTSATSIVCSRMVVLLLLHLALADQHLHSARAAAARRRVFRALLGGHLRFAARRGS